MFVEGSASVGRGSTIEFGLGEELEALRVRVRDFVDTAVIPRETELVHDLGKLEALQRHLQEEAAKAGIFAPHLPEELGGMGLDWRQTAVVLEEAGRSLYGPQALNAAAPDEGNTHLLDRLRELDGRLEELVEADPSAEVVRSLPGMGLVLTAEFLAEAGDASRFDSADRLAAAAGIVPVLRASGSVSYQRRERRGNRILKRVFYRSAFSAISCHEPSQTYYRRKRTEGKTAQQAVIALARRRVNVLWAMLRDGSIYEDRTTAAA